LLALVENERAQRSSVSLALKRQLLVDCINSERRSLLFTAHRWPPPQGARNGWAVSLSDDLPWPSGWPSSWSWPPIELVSAHDQSGNTLCTELAALCARNRRDDFDRILSGEPPPKFA
jgi:hypothetical protein